MPDEIHSEKRKSTLWQLSFVWCSLRTHYDPFPFRILLSISISKFGTKTKEYLQIFNWISRVTLSSRTHAWRLVRTICVPIFASISNICFGFSIFLHAFAHWIRYIYLLLSFFLKVTSCRIKQKHNDSCTEIQINSFCSGFSNDSLNGEENVFGQTTRTHIIRIELDVTKYFE